MPALPLVLAQCAGALDDCDLPRTLPWYFGLVIGVIWLATLVGVLLLLRRRLELRRQRRERQRGRDGGPKRIREGKGTDIEIW